MLVGPYLCKF